MRAAGLTVIMILAVAFGGCVAPPSVDDGQMPAPHRDDPAPGGNRTSPSPTWGPMEPSAPGDTRGHVGLLAGFRMQGEPMHAFFSRAHGNVTGPVVLEPAPLFPTHIPLVYFRNATVAGHGPGTLVVQAPAIALEGGARGITVTEARIDAGLTIVPGADAFPDRPELPLGSTWDDANRSFFFTHWVAFPTGTFVVDQYEAAVLVTDDAIMELVGTVEASADGFWWSPASHLRVQQVDVEPFEFVVGGNTESGSIDFQDRPDVDRPVSIVGYGGALRIDGHGVETTRPVRVTQAVDADGPVLIAEVVVSPEVVRVELARNATAWLAVDYEEATGIADALLENLTVAGSGAAFVSVPLERPPSLVASLWAVVDETEGWAKPIVALAAAIASPFAAFADIVSTIACAFTACPEQHPYPTMMRAGSEGSFYYRVDVGDADPGTYAASVVIEGRNHGNVGWDVEIVVLQT